MFFTAVVPVATPDDALGSDLGVGLRHLRRVGVSWGPDFGIEVGARELDPSAAPLKKSLDNRESWMGRTSFRWQPTEMIDDQWGWQSR